MVNAEVWLWLQLRAQQIDDLSGEKKKQEDTANERDRQLEDTRRRLVDKEAELTKLQNMNRRYENELEKCTQKCNDDLVRCAHTLIFFTICCRRCLQVANVKLWSK